MAHPILLYDGVCRLCNRLVQFILRRDAAGVFRFASLQSPLAARILVRHGVNPADLDKVYIVLNHDPTKADATEKDQLSESLLACSEAVLFVLQQLGGTWRAVAFLLKLVPRRLREWAYRLVARNRYSIFGRYHTCPLPSEDARSRFLDV
jgi:predicted DCC family thiol-disulfide oxidoreductase YuxK